MSALTIKDLSWIDKFIKKVKKYLFVRQEDGVLIMPPNRVYKLNKTALGLLKLLPAGKKIKQLQHIITGTRGREVHYFFCDLRAFYQDCTAFAGKYKAVQPTEKKIILTPYLRLDKDKQGRQIPEDIRFLLEPRKKAEDFVGVQLLVAINNGPNGAVPYMYAVSCARARIPALQRLNGLSLSDSKKNQAGMMNMDIL